MVHTILRSFKNVDDLKDFEDFDNLIVLDKYSDAFTDKVKFKCLDIQARMRTGLHMKKHPEARVFVQRVGMLNAGGYNLNIIIQEKPDDVATSYGYIECTHTSMFYPDI